MVCGLCVAALSPTTDSKHTMANLGQCACSTGGSSKSCPIRHGVYLITIRTRSGGGAAVLDLHSRKIVGWAMSPGMPAGSSRYETFAMAIVQKEIRRREQIVHSDREKKKKIRLNAAAISGAEIRSSGQHERKGNCWRTTRAVSQTLAA
jgi:transposase InsO family protein